MAGPEAARGHTCTVFAIHSQAVLSSFGSLSPELDMMPFCPLRVSPQGPPVSDPTVQLHVNLPALSAQHLRRLQRQLDVLRLLEASLEHVTEANVAETRVFLSFSPAAGAELPFQEAKTAAHRWLQSAFMRDAIESTGIFLDDCLSICNVAKLAGVGHAKGSELNHALHIQPQRYHKLHFPNKLAELRHRDAAQSQRRRVVAQ